MVLGCGVETQDATPTSSGVAPTSAPSTVAVPVASPTAVIPAGSLLFRADGNWASGLFVVNADGSGLSPLPSVTDHEARLSPDNENLAYTRDGHIWIGASDGSNAIDITPDLTAAAFVSWSPDGSRILFGYFSESSSEYWVMRRDGTDRVMIVPRCQLYQGDCDRPQWSRDGASLLAEIPAAEPTGGGTELVILGIDGAIQRRLPDPGDGWDEFAWSPMARPSRTRRVRM